MPRAKRHNQYKQIYRNILAQPDKALLISQNWLKVILTQLYIDAGNHPSEALNQADVKIEELVNQVDTDNEPLL